MDLTQEQSLAMDFLGDMSNLLTKENRNDVWQSNIIANRKYFKKGNPDLTGLTSFIVAAGPSLEKNAHILNDISERGVIVCVDAALRYLFKKGVRPEFCLCIDGSEKMFEMVKECDTSGIILVTTPSADPHLIDYWRGPRWFFTTPYLNTDKKFNHRHLTRIVKAKKELKPGDELFLNQEYEVEFEGVNPIVMCGGNVSTCAHHFALQYLKSQQVVFVGLDLSWKFQSHHYAGKEHMNNVIDRTTVGVGLHEDIDGKNVFTNLSLLGFKRWHEAMARQFAGTVINATEGGIFGIELDAKTQQYRKADFIEFLTLSEAIKKYAPKRDRVFIPPQELFEKNGHEDADDEHDDASSQ